MTILPNTEKLLARILKRTEERLMVEALGPCWEWQGGTQSKGYATISVMGHNLLVHRVVYAIVHGHVTEGQFVCHHCDNRICCRPEHLFEGTAMDNHLDMRQKGRDWKVGQQPKALTKEER